MEREAKESYSAVEKQMKEYPLIFGDLNIRHIISKRNIKYVVTVGRGSSDNVCLYGKYLFETLLGLPTVSAAPSVISIYNSQLNLQNALVIGISQSGQSSDICKFIEYATQNGALTISFLNNVDSPMGKISEFVIPILAGLEKAVAATKTFIASATSLAYFVFRLLDRKELIEYFKTLVEALYYVSAKDVDNDFVKDFKTVEDVLVLGRGYGLFVAYEAALKLKETCLIHSEGYSSAEVLHGPIAISKPNFPFVIMCQNDGSLKSIIEVVKKIKKVRSKGYIFSPDNYKLEHLADKLLLLNKSVYPILDPLLIIQYFYILVAKIAEIKGLNPDKPEHIFKVTDTL
jgi:glucosamine--fructose-6-phosphate aminotransferase (isomerizing)